jgi:hypothetical protein
MQPKVDERLQQALVSETDADELIEAVIRFDLAKAGPDTGAMPLVQRRERMAAATSMKIDQALERARQASGQAPEHVATFPTLGSAFVHAHRQYLKAHIDQAGVLGAALNSGSKR